MKKYLVSYTMEFATGVSFFNEVVECDGNVLSILRCIRESNDYPYKVNLVNFWEI